METGTGLGTGLSSSDLSQAVRETAMLVDVSISLWGAERTDGALMEKIKADAGAVGNVGRTIKNLLAGADGPLKDVRAAFQAVRSVHYGLTLPWVADAHAMRQTGPRLLPTMLWDVYTLKVAQARTAAFGVLDTFLTQYPDLIERARANLGDLARDVTYPTVDDVKAQFRITIDFVPIPAGTEFKGLPEGMLRKLSAVMENKQARMIESARTAMWEEARERVKHLADRLSDPEAKFKVTTVEAVRELVTLLPGWNVSQDARVAEVASDIESMLSGLDAKGLRENAITRQDVANQARAVTEKLNQWRL